MIFISKLFAFLLLWYHRGERETERMKQTNKQTKGVGLFGRGSKANPEVYLWL